MRVGARKIEVDPEAVERLAARANNAARNGTSPGADAAGQPSPKATLVLPAAPRELVPVPPPGTDASSLMVPRTSDSRPVLIRGTRRAPRAPLYRVVPRRARPRSFATQFLLALSITVAMCSVVALASPLNGVAGLGSGFQVYANAIPWVPTPTSTPKPTAIPAPQTGAYPAHGVDPGTQVVINEIKAVFGQYASSALVIARCESGYDPNAWNSYPIGNSHASGVFQILYPSTWEGTSYAAQNPYNYVYNIKAAYEIFSRDGYSWREWACKSAL